MFPGIAVKFGDRARIGFYVVHSILIQAGLITTGAEVRLVPTAAKRMSNAPLLAEKSGDHWLSVEARHIERKVNSQTIGVFPKSIKKENAMRATHLITTVLILLSVCAGPALAAPRVLCITEAPQTTISRYYDGTLMYMYLLQRYTSPQHVLGKVYDVRQVNWLTAPDALRDIDQYQALILWDTPARVTDKRNDDPHYRDLDIISDDAARRIVAFVENGGTLFVNGGVTNYGNGHDMLGCESNSRENKRHYLGYAQSPLAAILPVEMPGAVTLKPFFNEKTRLSMAVTNNDPVTDGLSFNLWGVDAYHQVKAKPNAEVLLATNTGDPLLVRWPVKKGHVVCLLASPLGNHLMVKDVKQLSNPLWRDEAVLVDRCLRWGLGIPVADAARDAYLRNRYSNNIASPARLPRSLSIGGYPYYVHAGDASIPGMARDLAMKYYADLGFKGIVMQFTPLDRAYLNAYTASLDRNNLVAFLHPEFAADARAMVNKTVGPEEYATYVQPSGKHSLWYGSPYMDVYSPLIREGSRKAARETIEFIKDYPQIIGAFYDDEWAWTVWFRHGYEGDAGISPYSKAANAHYKTVTGNEPPPPVYRTPGYVAPENDPWLNWCRIMRQDAYKDYNADLNKIAKEIRPGFLMSNYPGGFEGTSDMMVEEVYLDCFRVSELLTIERMDVRSNFREDHDRTRHPKWVILGIFRMPEDKSVYPETLRLTAGLCLGRGAKGLILWNGVNLWMPHMQHPGRDALEAEAKRLGEYLAQYGDIFNYLRKPESPVWISSSWFWVNSYDNYLLVPPDADTPEAKDLERPWWGVQISEVAVPVAMKAGLPVECVTEKQLASQDLFKKKAVILPGLQYCREGVVKNLEAYIKRGGKVFVDQSTKVNINGAMVLPVDFSKWHFDIVAGKREIRTPTEETYRRSRALQNAHIDAAVPVLREQITTAVDPDVRINSTEGVFTTMVNGDVTYLFVYNSNIDKGNTFTVTCRNFPRFAYDVETRAPCALTTKGTTRAFSLSLPAGGWKMIAFAPHKLTGIAVTQAQLKGDALTLRAHTRAGHNRFRGAVPVQITLRGAEGETVIYRATSDGVMHITIPIQDSVVRPTTVEVKELFSGQRATVRVR